MTDLAGVLWDVDPEPQWWRTPLGLAVARSVGRDDTVSVSRSVAAAMLNVHPGTVAQWAHRGKLGRHPDGGIQLASVLKFLIERETGRPL